MSDEVDIVDRHETMQKVVERYLKGENATAIARTTGMKRAEVLDYIDEYKQIAAQDDSIKERAREALHSADQHLNLLIQESWGIINNNADDKIRNVAIKNVADFEKSRVEMLQKAGLYDDAALGDEIAEAEEKMEAIKQLLINVTANCPHCAQDIRIGLARIFDQPMPMTVLKEDGTPA